MRTWSGTVRHIVPEGYARDLGVEAGAGRRGDRAVATDDLWCERPLNAKWTVAFRLVIQRDSLVVAEARVFPRERSPQRPVGEWSALGRGSHAVCPLGGLTTSLLRTVSPRDALRAAARQLAPRIEVEREFWGAARAHAAVVSPILKLPAAPGPGRRAPRIPEQELRRVARAYTRAYKRDTFRPIALAAVDLGKPRAWVRDRIRMCRMRHLLPEAHGPGRASI